MVQWLRICLPMLGTEIWSLVGKDSTFGRADRTVYHSYWAQALETASCNFWSLAPRAQAPREKPTVDPTRESPYPATKTQDSQKQLNKYIIFLMLPEKEKGFKKKKSKNHTGNWFLFRNPEYWRATSYKISEKILTLNLHFYIQLNYQSSIRAKKILFKLFNGSKFTTHKSFLEELQEDALQQNKTK